MNMAQLEKKYGEHLAEQAVDAINGAREFCGDTRIACVDMAMSDHNMTLRQANLLYMDALLAASLAWEAKSVRV